MEVSEWLAEELHKAAEANPGDEAGLRETADDLFRELPDKLGESETDIGSWEQIEKHINQGYADAVYGTAVVEYKAPDLLKENNSYTPNQKAINQTRGYLEDLEDLYHWPPSMLTGLVTDGKLVINVPVGREAEEPAPVNSQNLESFLRRFQLLSQTEPFDADRVKDYFGKGTKLTKNIVQDLFRAFQNRSSEQTDTYYDQWEYMFSVSHGSTGTRYLKELEKSTGVSVENKEEAMELLFCLYTYVVIVVKMIATNLVAYYSGLELQTTKLIGAEGEDLRKEFRNLEEAKLFEEKGIKNFAEGNFFSWYIYEWEEISEDITKLVETVGKFNPQSLANNPEETHDLLKGLYQDLVPRKLRHKLGEFYTPDWLAERTFNLTDYHGDPDERVLDPGCGSGTFLVEALRKIRSFISEKENSLSQEKKVKIGKKILNNIAGYDLNPVAVLAARTNFILAMGDIFKALVESNETIDLPVYLCDSILTPRLQAQLSLGLDVREITEKEFPKASDYDTKVYEIRTVEGNFPMPVSTVEANEVSKLTNLVEKGVKESWSTNKFWEKAEKRLETANEDSHKVLISIFEDIKELAKQKRDDIWPRILKNGFAQVMQEKFDYIVGNPPWVNWENLPEDWRDSSRILWEKYGLFTLSGYEQLLGGAKPDISMLFTYTSADNYLKAGGELSFVITQTLFKTSGAGDGFRRFQLGDEEYLSVKQVDDLVKVKPFKGASNRTAILSLEKDEKTQYPIPYKYWQRTKHRRVPEETPLEEVEEKWTKRLSFLAQPVDKNTVTSPWLTGRSKALNALRKVIGDSDYKAREGANSGGLNGAYWIKILGEKENGNIEIENLHDIGRKEVPRIKTTIEPDLVYPLLRGREVSRWSANSNYEMLVPQDMSKGAGGYPEETLKDKWPLTYQYLEQLKPLLKERSGFKQYFNPEEDPFYATYNVGPYTESTYKVVWKEQSEFLVASVIKDSEIFNGREKTIIPDHKLMLVPLESAEESHYVCALLNSSPAKLAIKSYVVENSTSTHVLENINIPGFKPNNDLHKKLSLLSEKAHEAENQGKQQIKQVEGEINKHAAKLWNISEEQLEDIDLSLKELE